jgi:hypothetical protein
MNILQKRAWIELILMVVFMSTAAAALAFMVHMNTKGITYVIISVTVGSVTGLVGYLHSVKTAAQYDEREKSILRRAVMLGGFALALVIGGSSFVAFFVVGGGGSVPVYVMPATFLGALFAAQLVQSAAILIQFAMEQVDE